MNNSSQWCFSPGFQSFGEYRWQFWDMNDNADSATGVLNDGDDVNYGKWPDGILNATWVKELYLISQDNSRRIFLRRALVESWDWNWTGGISWDNELWYTIQILKLRWFDAWSNHNFDVTTSNWVYDWAIDTWVCDYAQWFICNWSWIGNVYSWYRLPLNQNDWWVNLFEKNITISDRNISIYPTKYSEYAWAEDAMQLNPYFVLAIQSKLYWEIWQKRLYETMADFQFSLQTMFNIKNFYTK
jgi:hypothetical protein